MPPVRRYVLMSEPDHLWLKPMPNLMKGENPGGWVRATESNAWIALPASGLPRSTSVAALEPNRSSLLPPLLHRLKAPSRALPYEASVLLTLPSLLPPAVAAFPFFYIEPAKKEYRSIVETFLGPLTTKEAEQIAPIGEEPVRR